MQYLLVVTWESVWNVLKWVLAALAAGFIGQFGRSYAQHLMRRRKAREQPPKAELLQGGESAELPRQPEAQFDKERLHALAKMEKKRAKAEVKRQKKAQKAEED